jgi:hypothetical protein
MAPRSHDPEPRLDRSQDSLPQEPRPPIPYNVSERQARLRLADVAMRGRAALRDYSKT